MEEPPRRNRNLFLEALRTSSQPEPKPDPLPDWWKALTRPESPSLLSVFLEEPEVNLRQETTILAVWLKGKVIPGYDSSAIRCDSAGSVMLFSQYGNCKSDFGWQVDHIHPRSKGGRTVLTNLQPLNWRNNQTKKDKALFPPPIRQ